jgi:hypothetical protein
MFLIVEGVAFYNPDQGSRPHYMGANFLYEISCQIAMLTL